MTHRLLTFTLLLAGLAAPVTASAADTPPLRQKGDRSPLGDERLSNERTLTRWGHTNLIGKIRSKPSERGRTIAKLRWNTEDGLPEVYVVLESRLDDEERVWLQIRVPGRPNGRTGWVREEQLSNLKEVETHLTIDRRTLTATLRKRGKEIWTSRVGIGAPGTITPKGKFWIRERLRNLGGNPVYGPWAFGTSAYSDTLTDWPGGGVVGIHGTNQPELIPGRPSHGCVRLPNAKIVRLVKLMPVGTPVRIR
ncbi:MAG TPA: L,D-transpeptidase [Solirubrobacteraceae bacterium]|nr:L,D-transpeptidase [Solirubrobacteraceae bacterium]